MYPLFLALVLSKLSGPPADYSLAVPAAPRQSVADSVQARTLRQGVARRQPAESVEGFLQRVLPVSFLNSDAQPKAIQYAWRPSAFGKQLFFSARDPEVFYQLNVFVLDPYQVDTYAVERFKVALIGSQIPSLTAIFFADANHDGRKELLVLAYSPSRAPASIDGEEAHFYTCIYGYVPAPVGQRPHYVSYPRRPDLDDLETAAQVRQVLAAHVPKPSPRPSH